MARISAATTNDSAMEKAFRGQERKWGSVLGPYPVYARRPTIFRAVQGMWVALAQSGLIARPLVALVNRRVAALNGCVF